MCGRAAYVMHRMGRDGRVRCLIRCLRPALIGPRKVDDACVPALDTACPDASTAVGPCLQLRTKSSESTCPTLLSSPLRSSPAMSISPSLSPRLPSQCPLTLLSSFLRPLFHPG